MFLLFFSLFFGGGGDGRGGARVRTAGLRQGVEGGSRAQSHSRTTIPHNAPLGGDFKSLSCSSSLSLYGQGKAAALGMGEREEKKEAVSEENGGRDAWK